jgi:hypothetical protein
MFQFDVRKKLLLAALSATLAGLAAPPAWAQINLAAGDVALIGWVDNGSTNDAFALVALADLPAGTTMYFTDNGWDGVSGGFRNTNGPGDGNGNETLMALTTTAQIPAGTILDTTQSGPGYTWATSGAIPGATSGTFGYLVLAQSGDQIYAFQHDTGQKTLFAGTPYQAIIPSTAGNPSNGINDAELAFDAIVAHPSTAKFIARELLQRFVDENPPQASIDAVVAAWGNAANPHGIGDLREVLRAVLAQQEFLNPDAFGNKLKDPFEHVVSGLRALRGKTDGTTGVRNYISLMQELFHVNPVPTGYSELGGDWLDTNGLLNRQNFGLDMASRTATNWGADVIGLLNANGVSTAPTPNNAPAIVDFLSGVLFGGALTSAERQAAINYLNTDDNGVTSNYTDARIRETAGFLLGYAQFAEQ